MEFGFDNEFLSEDQKPSKPVASAGGGGWHWVLTLMSLLIVGSLSFLMAYLTKDVPERPVWLMGLIFVVPMAAMFISNMLVESHTSAMTPSYVRGKQWLLALLAVLGTLLVGCVCDLIYLGSFVEPVRERTIFVLDKSGSMVYNGTGEDRDAAMVEAVESCLDAMNPKAEVAVVLFHHDIPGSTELKALREDGHAATVRACISSYKPVDSDGTNFTLAMTFALDLVERTGSDKPTNIVFMTDGGNPAFAMAAARVAECCRVLNVTVDAVSYRNSQGVGPMQDVVNATGGDTVEVRDAASLVSVMARFVAEDADLLRSKDPMANLMAGIMLVLEGVVIGVGLWLTLSLSGQFRFQVILSPLMGVAALVLLKWCGFDSEAADWWLVEGAAFSLLGLVFMVRNRINTDAPAKNKPEGQSEFTNDGFGSAGSDPGF